MQNYSVQGNYIFIKPEHEAPVASNGRTQVMLTHDEMLVLHSLLYYGADYEEEKIANSSHTHLRDLGLIDTTLFVSSPELDVEDDHDIIIKLTPLGFLVASDLFYTSVKEENVEQGITQVLAVTLPESHWSVVKLNGASLYAGSPIQDMVNSFLYRAVTRWIENHTTHLPPEAYAALEELIEGEAAPTQELNDLVSRPRKVIKE